MIRPFALGVLFVHGNGTQRSGDTLVQWGDALVKTIRRVFPNDFTVSVEGTATEPDGVDPAEMIVRLGPESASEQWLLSECRWADACPAPTYREIVSWSVRATPWAVAIHIAQRYWQAARGNSRKIKRGRKKRSVDPVGLSVAVGQLLVAPALTLLLIILLGLGLVVGLLPVPQVRTFILALQSVLTATVGDSLAFVESPVRAALIRARIVNRLTRLRHRCARTIVVAHSQGAAAVLDTLGGIARLDYKRQGDAVPDTLLTFGAGTKQLASLIAQSNPAASDRGQNPALLSTWVLAAALGLGVWLFLDIRSLAYAGALTGLASAVFVLGMWAVARAIDRRSEIRGDRMQRAVARALVALLKLIVAILLLFVVGASAIAIAVRFEIPLISLPFLLAPLFMVGVSINAVLSTEMETLVTEQIERPPGLVRWIDIFASADPVPNGPTTLLKSKSPRWRHESIEIWNRGSLFGDHTAYWDNTDGFVLRVVKACAETAQSIWAGTLPSHQDLLELDKRSAWRVGFLRLARWTTGLTWALIAAFLAVRHRHPSGIARTVVGLPDWVPGGAADVGLVVAVVIGCAWVSYSVQKWFWLLWVRSEHTAALLRKPPQNSGFVPLLGMEAVFWFVVLVAAAFIWSDADAVKDQFGDSRRVLGGVLALLSVAAVSARLSLAVRRPPQTQMALQQAASQPR
jgi:hypothetical protein